MTKRSFPAFPPLPARPGVRIVLASSWWGREWVAALESPDGGADTKRLGRGRSYARAGNVGEITVTPGRIRARVFGSYDNVYRTSVTIPMFTDEQWERLLDAVAAQSGHLASLLDRQMPPELVSDAADAGVPLFPKPSQLDPDCSCPDGGVPCKHAAAVFYQVARLLDEDPFVLLLIRGRDEDRLLDELQRRNVRHAAIDVAEVPATETERSLLASAAFAAEPGPLPDPPAFPERVGPIPDLAEVTESDGGIDAEWLSVLTADTAVRAHKMLRAVTDGTDYDVERAAFHGHGLTLWQDAARLVAHDHHPATVVRLADAVDRSPYDLMLAEQAWKHGGRNALTTLDELWDPEPSVAIRLKEVAAELWEGERPPVLRRTRNRWTLSGHDTQLRYGRDGLWYPYVKEDRRWWPAAPPDSDPAEALTALFEAD